MALASLTLKDLVVETRAIPPFTGENSYPLSSFIREAETLVALVTDAESRTYLSRIILGKIQGAAARSIRRLLDPNWDDIKRQLIKSFGVPEEYLQLKEQADSIQGKSVSQIYSQLSKILDKLNLKYSLDNEKPADFKPNCNERSILEKFLNKIDRVDSMYIRTKGITTLEEAYLALLRTGINVNERREFSQHKNSNKNQRNKSSEHSNSHDPRNSGQFRNQSNQSQNRQNDRHFNPNNRNYENRNFNRRDYNDRNSNQNRFNNRNFYQNNPNRNTQPPEPMDIDHVVTISENFPVDPPIRHYP